MAFATYTIPAVPTAILVPSLARSWIRPWRRLWQQRALPVMETFWICGELDWAIAYALLDTTLARLQALPGTPPAAARPSSARVQAYITRIQFSTTTSSTGLAVWPRAFS